MGGKSSTSTSQVQIPQSVLDQYNNVNAGAQQAAQQPFNQYSQDPNSFVAPLNATEQAGVQNTDSAAGIAQPYFGTAVNMLGQGQAGAQPYYDASGNALTTGGAMGSDLIGTSLQSLQNAGAGAQPLNLASLSAYLSGAQQSAPFNGAAANDITGAQAVGNGFGNLSLGTLGQGLAQAQPSMQQALGTVAGSYAGAQPYNVLAGLQGAQGLSAATPLNAGAYSGAQGAAGAAAGAAGAASGGVGLAGAGAGVAQQGFGTAQQGLSTAQGLYGQGLSAASPLNQQAIAGLQGALSGAQPFNAAATNYATAGAGAVDPSALNIGQYMNPYLQTVLGNTSAMLNQNNQQQMSGELGNIINSGAFGGDRGGIAAANLAQQQQLANANIYSGITSDAYNNALATAQQQQGVGLAAGQANRSALQNASNQLLGIGQQGYAQGTGTAQALAGLGQNIFGQFGTAAQGLGDLSNSAGQVGVGAGNVGVGAGGVGVQGAGVGVQAAGVQNQAAQTQADIAQNVFGQNLSLANLEASLGQQGFQQGQTAGTNTADIANTEFGQSLASSQQQSGLGQYLSGLGLAAGSQTAGLGQQIFGQGQTLGSGLQGLGSQVFGQGATTAAQQAALGQQAFGQGATTAQQLQALGQGVFGMGQSGASTLADLGTGAQGAALSGAQAQLQAGQLGQQTSQAGLTALYNQFLQQQSYPFQVAQFLANIAEGTGSLSGSTTTTTTPGGLFSDKRLKDDVRPIGETFDHQPIYSFKYKGDDTTHMGLMAQDVEKRNPDAVGLAGGYKTVDYKKATDDAAERGKFSAGGVPGFDPQIMQQLLQNSAGMFGPYISSVAGGIASPNAGPYGASARVPAANLPVSHLQSVKAPRGSQESGLAAADRSASSIANLAKDASKGADWVKGHLPGGNDNDSIGALSRDLKADNDSDMPWNEASAFYRGGLVPAKRYASGGAPYEGQVGLLGLDIPDDDQKHELLTAQNAGSMGGRSGLGQTASDIGNIAGMAKAGSTIAQSIPEIMQMFALKDGGAVRPHLAGGGFLDYLADAMSPGIAGDPSPQTGPKTPEELATQMRANYDAQNNQGPTPKQVVQQSMARRPPPSSGSAKARGPVASASDQGSPDELNRALNSLYSDQTAPAQPSAQPTGGLVPASNPISGPLVQQTMPEITPAQDQSGKPNGLGTRVAKAVQDTTGYVSPHGGYVDRMVHGDKQALIPFLVGLGAMTAAPTRNFGVALAQGLSAGAKTYQEMQVQQAGIGNVQAEAEQRHASAKASEAQAGYTTAQAQQIMQNNAPVGTRAVPGENPNGKTYPGPDGKPWHYVLQTNLTDYGSSPTGSALAHAAGAHQSGIAPSSDTDQVMAQTYGIDTSQPGVANRTRMLSLNPALAAQEDAAEKAAQARIGNLGEQDTTHRQLLQSAEAINGLSHGTLTGQGADSANRAHLASMYQTITGMLGVSPDPTVNADLTAHQITEKIRQLSGAAMAHQYGERAASVAHSISDVMPSGDITPDASSHIIAQMMVQNQQAKDFAQYHNNYVARYGTPIGIDQAFARDTGQAYDVDQQKLSGFLKSAAFPVAMKYLTSADPAVREGAIARIDKAYGQGIHRYLTGGM